MKIALLIIFAFALGSVPFGVIIAKIYGVNLKKVGSGNIGATNVLRTMGKWPALFTLFGDVMKGAAPVVAGKYIVNDIAMEGIIGVAAILGHNYSIFLRFKGGKGVATSLGVLLIYSPKAALVTVVIWLSVIFLTRYSSLGAIISFAILPLAVYILDYSQGKLMVSLLISGLLILRHADNIKRLSRGKEPRIGERTVG